MGVHASRLNRTWDRQQQVGQVGNEKSPRMNSSPKKGERDKGAPVGKNSIDEVLLAYLAISMTLESRNLSCDQLGNEIKYFKMITDEDGRRKLPYFDFGPGKESTLEFVNDRYSPYIRDSLLCRGRECC